ncbi:MAG TPA: KEOPS complex subunit Pcc1 [Candidatus Nanoarchaeia archaeon]|nr:KEOPS complex subunit Pcc1 [Candidatus Nanoarchaeia archaeon]
MHGDSLLNGATVRISLKSEKQVTAVLKALTPELTRQIGVRSKTTLNAKGVTLILNFEANDTVALRAAVNAYLRWINSVMNVLDVASRKS